MKCLMKRLLKDDYLVNRGYVCSGIDQHLHCVSVTVLGGHMQGSHSILEREMISREINVRRRISSSRSSSRLNSERSVAPKTY